MVMNISIGFGLSPPPDDGDYSMPAHVRAVVRLIESEGRVPVHLFGNSLGGAVATVVAARRPELVRTLTLVSPALPDFRQNLLLEDRTLLTYRGSCYTVFLEVRQLRLPPTPRRDIRLVINLKDIGTLLDMHQSVDRLFGQ